MENTFFNTCFERISFEYDIYNSIKKIVNELSKPECDYIDDVFIEFVFNKTDKLKYYDDLILPIHYLFLHITPGLLKRITKLKLNFSALSQNNKNILYFLFERSKKVVLTELIEFLDYNNMNFFELNNENPFVIRLFSSLYKINAPKEEQIEWFDYVFSGEHKELLTRTEKDTRKIPMMTIIYGLDLELTKKIVEQIVNLNILDSLNNYSALHYICSKQNSLVISDIKKIHYLIDNGANINLKNSTDVTPFQLLCSFGVYTKYIIEFLKKGADPNIIISNDNIAFTAIKNVNTTIEELKEIFSLGVDYNYKNDLGHTILSLATYLDSLPYIKYLLELGMDIHNKPKNNNGLTPLHFVLMRCSEETINYVLDKITNLLGETYYTEKRFKIKYPYEFLCYNTKVSDNAKIKIYKKVFEYIRETKYKYLQFMWPIDSKLYYKIPTKLTVKLDYYSDLYGCGGIK